MTNRPAVCFLREGSRRNFFGLAVIALASACWTPYWVFGQLPAARLSSVFPAGGRAGQTVEVTISGIDLDEVDALWFSHPGLRAERKMAEPGPFDKGPQPVPNVFLVTVAPDVPPGCYDIRAKGLYGLSNPRTFEVGQLPELGETEPNNDRDQAQAVPTELGANLVINGQSAQGGDLDWYRVRLSAGQRISLRCAARRLDSLMDAVLQVFDSNGRLLGEYESLAGNDIVTQLTAPSEGDYFFCVYDILYRGGAEYYYRLTISEAPVVDFVFPPMIVPGATARLSVYGRNLPGGVPSPVRVGNQSLEKIELDVSMPADIHGRLPEDLTIRAEESGLDAMRLVLPGARQPLDPVLIYPATAPVVLENEVNHPAQKAQRVSLPCEIAGQFYPLRDTDWFEFDAKQGEQWAIELYYNRVNGRGAPRLMLFRVDKKDDGSEQLTAVPDLRATAEATLSYEFDPRSGDPGYLWRVAADGTYRLKLEDAQATLRADPTSVYRLALRRPQPDFRLIAFPWECHHGLFLRKGGRAVVHVLALRQDGFDGEIQLSVSGLPEGVTAADAVIGPGATQGAVVLTCAENAPAVVAPITVQGRAVVEGQTLSRTARYGMALPARGLLQPGEVRQSVPGRLMRSMVLSISNEEMLPVMVSSGEQPVWETSRGGILKIPLSLTRRDNYNGSLTVVPLGLPANVSANPASIGNGANNGELELRFAANAPIGTYTLCGNAYVQGYQYARNPAAAKAAAERKAELDKIVAELQEKVKQTTQERDNSQKMLDEAKQAVQKATAARDQAARMVAEAQAALKAAQEAAERAKRTANEKPEDTAAATAAAQAAKAAAEAETRAKDAAKTLEMAEKMLTEAQQQLQTAETKRAEAEQLLQKTTQLFNQAQQLRQQADQRAQQLQNASRPQAVNFWTPSTPITIRIAESPVALAGLPDSLSVKQGEKLEQTVKVTRSFGFQGPVNLNWQFSGSINGVQLPNIQVPNGQEEGKLTIAASDNAAQGQYNLRLQIQVNFNGQNVVTEKQVTLSINPKQ
jgi:hypothetical protein